MEKLGVSLSRIRILRVDYADEVKWVVSVMVEA